MSGLLYCSNYRKQLLRKQVVVALTPKMRKEKDLMIVVAVVMRKWM